MPKKKKGGKKKKKATGKSDTVAVPAGPTELELSLRSQLVSIETEFAISKQEMTRAKILNDSLKQQLEETEEGTKDYEEFMKKKNSKEESKIQVLNEETEKKMDEIREETRIRVQEYEKVKAELRDEILEQESMLDKTNSQVTDLGDVQRLRDEQEAEIAALEKLIGELEQKHEQELRQLKSQFLEDKMKFQKEAHTSIRSLETKAQEEAFVCLDEQSVKVTRENQRLRDKLLKLMAKNRQLQERETMLKKQNQDLGHDMELLSSTTMSAADMMKIPAGGGGGATLRSSRRF